MRQIIKPLELGLKPEELFQKLSAHTPCFWLDSALTHQQWGVWSYFGFAPFLKIRFRAGKVSISGLESKEFESRAPISVLRDYFARWRSDFSAEEFPFFAGGVGYLSYELGNYLERLPFKRKDDLFLDELRFDFYQFIIGYHHLNESWYLLGIEDETLSFKQSDYLERFQRLLDKPADFGEEQKFSERVLSNFTKEEYLRAIVQAKEYIRKGDIYQVNFTQRFSAEYSGSPAQLYLRLRKTNPGFYAGAFLYSDFSILSSSPELFLKVSGKEVITRPIKGTRARGKNPEQDTALKKELLASEKDLAELAMIVDLERNDLGRVCDYGTVQVLDYPELESYARVHHLLATVRGELAKGKDKFDLLRATFPGGSITGAPKIRAMEIIDELEPNVRAPYTGSIGWISFGGNLELNIAIRVMILKEGQAYFPAGGGIVYDSEPELEYEESWLKALGLWEALSKKG